MTTPTLNQTLSKMTVYSLKTFLYLVPNEKGGSKKADLVQRLVNGMQGDKLKAHYNQLDKWQKLAVAEALYDQHYCFYIGEFKAKYGEYPTLSVRDDETYNSSRIPTRLHLFLYPEEEYNKSTLFIPYDLTSKLKTFVAKPAPVKLPSCTDIPDGIPVTIRLCEQEAIHDLSVVLSLVQQNKLKVSAKTSKPSAATVKLLDKSFSHGDFYALKDKPNKWTQVIGPIKSFAWPLLLQASPLVKAKGTTLELTASGKKQLSHAAADKLKILWQKWQNNKLLDEFSRIDEIKGQQSKGRVMTATAERRQTITSALMQCPVGEWVAIDDFFNFMQASKLHFEVTHQIWKLYLCDQQYGSLGYDSFHNWTMLQGRYIMCLLFEYAATLGMVDVAYEDPDQARDDYHGNWGTDDMDFLSRYDGLLYFRLTALGEYCLGLTGHYEPATIESNCEFRILPSLHISLVSGQLSPEDTLLLDTWTVEEADNSWRLDKIKSLIAIENGHDIETLQTFLEGKDEQILPESVESFISTCKAQSGTIKHVASAVLLECKTEKIAEALAKHKETRTLCQRVGKKQLVIKQDQEEKFRQAARIVGYSLMT